MSDQINELKKIIAHRDETPTGKEIKYFLDLINEIHRKGVDLPTLKELIKEWFVYVIWYDTGIKADYKRS